MSTEREGEREMGGGEGRERESRETEGQGGKKGRREGERDTEGQILKTKQLVLDQTCTSYYRGSNN